VAATAGTSGVIYGVSDQLTYDNESRVNTFAHVNYTEKEKRLGVLLCINGTGISNRWIKDIAGGNMSYQEMNAAAKNIMPGSDGVMVFPFGNGAERMFNNKTIETHLQHIDLNKHNRSHLFRATQEGIAFAFRYGLDIMRQNGMNPQIIRVGKANMFLSEVFTECFVNTLNVPVEMYNNDGSTGAAIGAGLGAKIYSGQKEAFRNFKPIQLIEPSNHNEYNSHYNRWLTELQKLLN
jgi:xylulokinase